MSAGSARRAVWSRDGRTKGPLRLEGTRAPRPRNAATLVLYRQAASGAVEVLMGERHGAHKFMPNRYVFPGGRIERGDAAMRAASEPASGARAYAMAAVRELFEETGLRLAGADPAPGRPVPAAWREFNQGGHAPALAPLTYVARAITPPYRPVRFDARFFMADAAHLSGEIKGSGELLDLRWVAIERTLELPLPNITGIVLGHVADRLARRWPGHVPFYRMSRGKYLTDPEP